MKKIIGVYSAPRGHWVGDGFPVRSLFSYSDQGKALSPFLLLDYAGPAEFKPTTAKLGVGEHPHRGFETVTIIYDGEVEHRDSTGSGGKIGPGDVQWMTAGSGIQHEEFHSRDFARTGGTLHMVQLWVNLPAADKMTAPRYQTLLDAAIPSVALPQKAGRVRVIAGEYAGRRGPAQTFTPVDAWDVRLNAGRTAQLAFAEGRTVALVVLQGTVQVNGSEVVREAQLAVLDRQAGEVLLEANADAKLLVLSGEPIDEPIVGYGPFVMNTEAEIRQAIEDFNSGQFGRIPPVLAVIGQVGGDHRKVCGAGIFERGGEVPQPQQSIIGARTLQVSVYRMHDGNTLPADVEPRSAFVFSALEFPLLVRSKLQAEARRDRCAKGFRTAQCEQQGPSLAGDHDHATVPGAVRM